MAKVVQIRDVPDEVHEALTAAAAAEGLSLTRYLLREMEHVARRPEAVRHNAEVVRRTQEQIQSTVSRAAILAALEEGRRG